jgi:hypothetical protein
MCISGRCLAESAISFPAVPSFPEGVYPIFDVKISIHYLLKTEKRSLSFCAKSTPCKNLALLFRNWTNWPCTLMPTSNCVAKKVKSGLVCKMVCFQSSLRVYVNHGEQGAPTIVELRQDVTHEEHAGFGRERTLLKGLNQLYASIINMGRRFETR